MALETTRGQTPTSVLGVVISTPEELNQEMLTQAEQEGLDYEEAQGTEAEYSLLAAHIVKNFETNKGAKKDSGIEDEIFNSLKDYNGVYSTEDLGKIAAEGGSSIYMNLTATKSRAAMSWIRDILLSANEDSFSVKATPIPSLPEDLEATLDEAFRTEFLTKAQEAAAPVEGAPGAPSPTSPKAAQDTITSMNRDRRDVKDAIIHELNLEAAEQMALMERKIKDDLKEGEWDQALSDFIEDFCIFPAAFMKGPVVTKKDRLRWEGGKPIVENVYTFLNKRVSPMDVYPAPTSTSPQEGNFIEHLRLSAEELAGLRGAVGYHTEAIDKLLEENEKGLSWVDTGIESEKAEEEKRGSVDKADEGVFHALHYWGTAKGSDVEGWGLDIDTSDPNRYWEIEAILVGTEIIKCKLNMDPLKRRPYYKASYQNTPGSFWGRSLPSLMRDIQRMCNACARALANNMGLAAGPQIELYIDRLADAGDIEDIKPLKIWQVTNDPTGASGRAINFFQVPSIANELLGVYEKFEQKADDATGIPRYSYGNEKVGGAAQTASGLSMLLESATKSIKDAIRHIDSGLIIPRVEYQFYWNLIKNTINYTGDVNVIAHGSDTLTMRGAQQAKRQEFLQITANQSDQDLMGPEGRAELIRELAKDLNLRTEIVPSRLEIRKKVAEAKAAAEQAAQNGTAADQASLKATQLQIDGQKEMHAQSLQLKAQELQQKGSIDTQRNQIEAEKVAATRESTQARAMTASETAQVQAQAKKETARTSAAVSLMSKGQ